jgi:hypothetical protein
MARAVGAVVNRSTHKTNGVPLASKADTHNFPSRLGQHREEIEPLAEDALRYLDAVLRAAPTSGRHVGDGIAAARMILDQYRWQQDRNEGPMWKLVQLLGSEEAALAWMRETMPKLEATIGRRSAAQSDGGHAPTGV